MNKVLKKILNKFSKSSIEYLNLVLEDLETNYYFKHQNYSLFEKLPDNFYYGDYFFRVENSSIKELKRIDLIKIKREDIIILK